MRLIADTNTIIYFLNGRLVHPDLAVDEWAVSVITEIELLGSRRSSPAEIARIGQVLADIEVVPLDDAIKQCAITIRRASGLKASDAVVAATAVVLGAPIVSNDRQMASVPGLTLIVPTLR